MQKINFQDGTLVKPATITINNVEYQVTPEQYNGTTPLSAELLNQLQTNIENAIGDISSFEHLIVTELPTENIQEDVLYIVKSGSTGEETYDAYIYDSEKGWIPVGSSNGKTYLNKETEYIMVVEQDISGETELTIPCNYKVGADSLVVYYGGDRLNKATLEDGSDGYYKEVGTTGSTSNKIKIGNDTYTIKAGEMFTFIVKEHLENIPAIDVLEQLQDESVIVSPTEPTASNRRKIWFQKGKNLFDGNYVENHGYDATTGNMTKMVGISCNLNSIKISPNSKIITSKNGSIITMRYFFYNKNKQYISTIVQTTEAVTVPTNAEYCNFQVSSTDIEMVNIQIEQNTVVTEYEAYVEPKIYVLNKNNVYEEFRRKQEINIITGVESETGRIVDGKKEYQKKLSLGNLPNATAKYILTGLSNVTFTRPIQGIRGNESIIPFYNKSTDRCVNIDSTSGGDTLTIGTNYNFSNQTAWVDLYYTKN